MLFVYGTLRSEFDNPYARLLRSQARTGWSGDRAWIDLSRGPLSRLSGPSRRAKCMASCIACTDPETTLKALDEYEGEDFERVVVNGAWIYRYQGSRRPNLPGFPPGISALHEILQPLAA